MAGKCNTVVSAFAFLGMLVALVTVATSVFLLLPGTDEPIPTEGWWGFSESKPDSNKVTKMIIHYSNESLDDLKNRLSQTRYVDPLIGTQWEYGVETAYMKELVEYWKNMYDWRKQERILNAYDQFTTTIEGIKIHFLHYKPAVKRGQRLIPILLIHGWPGSFYEFYKLIPKLEQYARGEFVFKVVCP